MTLRRCVVAFVALCTLSATVTYIWQSAAAQTTHIAISGKFYKFDTVAQVGQDNLASISGAPSLNDSGTLVFSGKTVATSQIEELWRRRINGSLATITSGTLTDGTNM
jgi:hypothetical protein